MPGTDLLCSDFQSDDRSVFLCLAGMDFVSIVYRKMCKNSLLMACQGLDEVVLCTFLALLWVICAQMANILADFCPEFVTC